MIPKIIHYVWVGDQPKSDLVLKCIESWQHYLPDYKIMEWGNSEFKKIKNLYAQEAYENSKWAFVSDYIRLYALEKYGGFYFDTDLEITNDISCFRNLDFLTGYEKYGNEFSPVTAFMGSTPGQRIISGLLTEYNDISFFIDDKVNLQTNTDRISKYFDKNFNLTKPYNGLTTTNISLTEKIYPYTFFCTKKKGCTNYSIHHFDGSWIEDIYIKTKITIWRYKIVRYKFKVKSNRDEIKIDGNESLIFTISIGLKRKYCLIKYKQ